MPFASFGRRRKDKKAEEEAALALRKQPSNLTVVPPQRLLEYPRDEGKKLEELWRDWEVEYASGSYNIETPRPPPCHPYATPGYQPLRHPEDDLHQRVLDSYNVYGSPEGRIAVMNRLRSMHPYAPSMRPETPFSVISASSSVSTTLIDHRLCHEIVSQARLVFDACSAILCVLDGDKMVYLASSGHERNMPFFAAHDGFLPRQASYCAHTVLNRDRGFVICDSSKDWRFAKNGLGMSFYAGYPITVPIDLNDSNGKRAPIGCLCLMDGSPRAHFDSQQRKQLSNLAEVASINIEAWARQRHDRRPSPPRFSEDSKVSFEYGPAPLASTGGGGRRASVTGRGMMVVLEEGDSACSFPADPRLVSRWSATTAAITTAAPSFVSPSVATHFARPRSPSPSGADSSGSGEKNLRRLPPSTQFLIDLAVSSVASRLSVPLVYVLHIRVSKRPQFQITKSVVTCVGDPESYLHFPGGLHLRAMRAGEDGLPYRPAAVPDEMGLAGGVILPVMRSVNEEEGEESGAVLAVFWAEEGRALKEEDNEYLHMVVRAMVEHAV
ncbi:hypothetical protein JCM6882_002546 [Rhodosporidiobolus microsporus]